MMETLSSLHDLTPSPAPVLSWGAVCDPVRSSLSSFQAVRLLLRPGKAVLEALFLQRVPNLIFRCHYILNNLLPYSFIFFPESFFFISFISSTIEVTKAM